MTENTNITPLDKRCEILADLWIGYQTDPEFKDFIEYSDLALPLAYSIANNIIKIDYDNDRLNEFIDEAFDLLVEGLGLEDTGFDSIKDLFDTSLKEE
jgi:hypothetical protein